MNSKVSVIMSVYNGERFLSESIEGILNQTFNDFEFIIINDGSTDSTEKILESYNDSRIKVFNQKNVGLTKSLNKAIKLSNGKYIARMDADDYALPERFQKQVNFLDVHTDIGMIGTYNMVIDEQGKVIEKKRYPVSDNELRLALIRYNPFFHSSVMIRREVLEIVGFYNENKRIGQDYELWFRVANQFKLANLPEFLLVQRRINNSISQLHENEQYITSISTRIEAVSRKQYPWWCIIYLIKPFAIIVIPFFIKKIVRRYLLGRKIYN